MLFHVSKKVQKGLLDFGFLSSTSWSKPKDQENDYFYFVVSDGTNYFMLRLDFNHDSGQSYMKFKTIDEVELDSFNRFLKSLNNIVSKNVVLIYHDEVYADGAKFPFIDYIKRSYLLTKGDSNTSTVIIDQYCKVKVTDFISVRDFNKIKNLVKS